MEITSKKDGFHLSLAFQNLEELPEDIIRKHSCRVSSIDLSFNKFTDLHCLRDFQRLHTVTLDSNLLNSFSTFPLLHNINYLSINQNSIDNLTVFISRLCEDLPKLKFLSMMKNEAAPSYFNGGTKEQNQDYRYYVISHFVFIENIDGEKVLDEEKNEAYKIYGRRWKRRKRLSTAYY